MSVWLADFIKALYKYPLKDLENRVIMLEARKKQMKQFKKSRYNQIILNSINEELKVIKEVLNDRKMWDKIV